MHSSVTTYTTNYNNYWELQLASIDIFQKKMQVNRGQLFWLAIICKMVKSSRDMILP